MSLLGLMLGELVARNLATEEGERLARRLSGRLGVVGGKMAITVAFSPERVLVSRGLADGLRARIRGSLDGLLQVSLGRGAIRAFLAGDVSIRGNPLFALKTLPLMRAPRGASEKEPR